ncbi:alpha-1,3/1,6-mannosyltransferase ALG2 [Halteromyces radiatus]|uniref:alpha-1,3/1,6-mannosyltransferase ALG2 n=1 Tax=Halteromyces radiatus TaxID=101107 RepID=UPI00221E8443|nr:alpha-1,3/1,6-mannosyltransferase ALG2 [Halteromyces radiatus]KAI8092833.1 alpha-1,3/1,6-mannosyltransferase ALG2 [Halteromyces radiatus]
MSGGQDGQTPLKIAFIHPDLGIGGAERLVVDAAMAAQSKGHQVIIYTSHHDRSHCFEETRDGTLSVQVIGDSLPRHIFGKFFIVCAILRQLALSLWLLQYHRDTYDVLFIDQLSACIPLLKWFSSSRVLFYCHFPDKLLAKRDSQLREIYRYVFDKLEELTTGLSDTIVVNSGFTGGMFKRSFPTILKKPRVLYPPINFDAYDRTTDYSDPQVQLLESHRKTLLSINRFERKKNVELALRAFAELKNSNMIPDSVFNNYRLVLAGGYDKRVQENVDYLNELDILATETFQLKTARIFPDTMTAPSTDAQVIFVCSFNDAQRTYLLANSELLLYTPTNEHFGITPVEGMYASIPVIATNTGGPLETIKDKETGLLLPPEPKLWADGIGGFISKEFDGPAMGRNGRSHVKAKFSLSNFANQLEDILEEMMSGGRPTRYYYMNVEFGCRIIIALVMIYIWYHYCL